jgi:hypothetical protein
MHAHAHTHTLSLQLSNSRMNFLSLQLVSLQLVSLQLPISLSPTRTSLSNLATVSQSLPAEVWVAEQTTVLSDLVFSLRRCSLSLSCVCANSAKPPSLLLPRPPALLRTLSTNVGNLLLSLVRNHRDGPLVATEAMIVFHAFLFSLRRLIDDMNSLWQAGNELVALSTLYSKGVLTM